VVAKQEEEADEDELQFQFQEADQCKDAEFQFQGSNLLNKDTPMILYLSGCSTTCGASGSVSNSIVPSTTGKAILIGGDGVVMECCHSWTSKCWM
jgi:hypothetical protein